MEPTGGFKLRRCARFRSTNDPLPIRCPVPRWSRHFQLFYILFLPIIWIAVRAGLQGVTAGILVAQIGLIVGVYLGSRTDVDLTVFQALMLVLAITGLVAGALITERHRTEFQLRTRQESPLARFAHLNNIGGLAAALAHEINQPLMAAETYSRLIGDFKRGEQSNGIVEIAD
jgi:glucose-6-phosphate-specific signal transduction histidine kinase